MERKKQLPDIPQEKPETVELTDGAYEWYANDNDTLTTWTGYAAPDWAAGARTLDAMARWSYGLGIRFEGDPAKVRQWTGTTPGSASGPDRREILSGLYGKYANCRRWWTAWQGEHTDETPKNNLVLLDTKSCHDVMCPNCMRLKAHKRELAYTAAWNELQEKKISRDGTGYRLLQIVVDIGPNCQGDDLRDSLSRLISGTHSFIRWLNETKGVIATAPAAWIWGQATDRKPALLWMLGTEITRHNEDGPQMGTYHPHVHLMIAVNSRLLKTSTVNGKKYTRWRETSGMAKSEMLDKWRCIMGDSSIKNLYMGEVDNPHQALKYAVKGAIAKKDSAGDSALYIAGEDWDSYNMDTLQTVHDAIVEYREDSRNRSRQMFRASLGWAHLAGIKAEEMHIRLDDTDSEDAEDDGGIGRLVRGRQRHGKLEAVSVDRDRISLTEAKEQVQLEQRLRLSKYRKA